MRCATVLFIKIKISLKHVKYYFCGLPFYRGKNIIFITNNIKKLIIESGFFNAEYYLQQLNFKSKNPLNHYLKKGWKLNLNPSQIFDGVKYIEKNQSVKINPLLHFILSGRNNFIPAFYGDDPFTSNQKNIREYLSYKEKRKAKGVVYTCISNNYDTLKQHRYINFDLDYVCFTDDKEQLKKGQEGIWTIVPFSNQNVLEGSYINRWHKTHPNELFREYDYSIYIDANINVLTDFLYKTISYNKDIQLPKHQKHHSPFDEFPWYKTAGFNSRSQIEELENIMIKDGFPKNYGANECCIIFRKHNKNIEQLNELWWFFILNYSRRDQASFDYCCWKCNYKYEEISIPPARPDIINFAFFAHNIS